MNTSAWIRTYSGGKFYVLDPRAQDIRIKDIAHSLSLICRFTGHVKSFYSVAQHSVEVSTICDPADALWGLLHDATEAYIGDLNRPLKHTPEMVRFRTTEKHIMLTIAEHFGLPAREPDSVKRADSQLVVTEARDLLSGGTRDWEGFDDVDPLPGRIIPQSPRTAEKIFLARFKELDNLRR